MLSLLAIAGCGGSTSSSERPSPGSAPVSAPWQQTDVDDRPRVVFLGDSLTAGLGLPPEQAYPTLIQHRVDAESLGYHVVNAGVSGDTSAGGLSRLDWALDGDVKVLVVALGANDGLRGLPPRGTPEEPDHHHRTCSGAGRLRSCWPGWRRRPTSAQTYTVSFRRVYAALAEQYGVPLVPFLLQGVAGIEELNQRDGIHPTAEGARMVADNVWTVLRPTLKGS